MNIISYLLALLEYPTRQEFLDQVYQKSESKSSVQFAKYSLKAFDQYLVSIKETENNIFNTFRGKPIHDIGVYNFLNKIISYWSKSKDPQSIRGYMSIITAWLTKNGIMIMPNLFKQYMNFPKKVLERRKPITIDQIINIIKASHYHYNILWMFLATSGLRVSEALKLVKSDLDLKSTPLQIHVRADNTKGREERETYTISPCKAELLLLCQNRRDQDLVFGYKLSTVEKCFRTVCKKLGYNETYTNGRFFTNVHSLRSYFFTLATLKHGSDYAHAVTGHHAYLDQYFRLSEDKRKEMYMEIEPELSKIVA